MPINFIEEAIRTQALSDAALANLVEDRFYLETHEQGDRDPAIILNLISGMEDLAHDGPTGLAVKRYQFTVRSNCFLKNEQIIARLKKIFNGFSGRLANEIYCGNVKHAGDGPRFRNVGENVKQSSTDFMFTQRIEQ